jgi:hypothetical protein
MDIGIQTPDSIHVLEQLQPADTNLELPTFDPSTLIPVYPSDPGWIRQGWIAGTSSSFSINSTSVDIFDTEPSDFTIRYDATQQQAFDIGRNRQYSLINIIVGGGTISPITVELGLDLIGVTTFRNVIRSVPNPGRLMLGPIFVPIGWRLFIQNITQGGAGDTLTATILGIQARSGVPIPTFSGVGNVEVSP